MSNHPYTKEQLISLLKDLEQRLGVQPTKKQWDEDALTPSEMPIRMNFGNWTNFIVAAGYVPRKPRISEQAQLNSIKAHKGKRSFRWKGGRIKDSDGYIQVWMPDHPNARLAGYIHEHRLVMSEHLGRPLEGYESVHHKNGIKDDNRIENLELMTKRVHHGEVLCPHCHKTFRIR